MIDQKLIQNLSAHFVLEWSGIHGASHWERVRENGLRLAPLTGARIHIVELFAFLHDLKRRNECHDPDHGPRAARFVKKLGAVLDIDGHDLELLVTACRHHSDGFTTGDLTILTCWDADRLDLGRVGIKPNPRHLCTEAASDSGIIEWAYEKSINKQMPKDFLQPR